MIRPFALYTTKLDRFNVTDLCASNSIRLFVFHTSPPKGFDERKTLRAYIDVVKRFYHKDPEIADNSVINRTVVAVLAEAPGNFKAGDTPRSPNVIGRTV